MPARPEGALLPDWAALAIVACSCVLVYGLAFGIIAGWTTGWIAVAIAIAVAAVLSFAYRRLA